MSLNKPYRYAIYFAGEPKSELWTLGSEWLGRCSMGAEIQSFESVNPINRDWRWKMTQHPRRYGWHATLKAPFRLKQDLSVETLLAELKQLSHELRVFELPLLEVKRLKNFLALAPLENQLGIEKIAAAAQQCVEHLSSCSEPLTASEIAYRNESALSEREQVLLRQWGYPYVKELYQFHFTLSDGLDTSSALEIHELTQAAKAWFDFVQPLRFDRIALFVEECKGQDFQFLTDFVIPQ